MKAVSQEIIRLEGELSMKRFGVYLSSLCGLMLLFWPSATLAWGCKGHQTGALIAEKHLTAQAKHLVQKLLTDNPSDPKLIQYGGGASRDAMAEASTWADDVRG